MGGDIFSSSEEESSLEQDFPKLSFQIPNYLRDVLSMKVEDGKVNEEHGSVFGEYGDLDRQFSSTSLNSDAHQRMTQRVYKEILLSYGDLRSRSGGLEEAKSKILSYTPGAWIEKVSGTKLSDYDVPKTTTLILIGPKGSGKSSLVNRISRVFKDDKSASDRAQVSFNSSVSDGTYFLQEYMIPRGSTSFCLYDTRSLSSDSSDNIKMLERWLTKGVCHGELVIRDSDGLNLRTRMKSKARWIGYDASKVRMVNFVIYVVNGLSVLKALDSKEAEDKHYTQLVASTFNSPYLSFKDDKPVIAVTHGDLLSLSDRARIRVHLGELLGIPPAKQIFDIPESYDPATDWTIVDMLRYSLEHADRNIPRKNWLINKVQKVSILACIVLLIALWIAIVKAQTHRRRAPRLATHIKWHAIRHLWLDE